MNVNLSLLFLLVPALLAGQAPRVGILDFYGLGKMSEARIREVLGVKEGDPLPPSKADLEERLEKLHGVVRASVTAVCCDAGKAILFVGIEQKGAPRYNFRDAPSKDVALPKEITGTYAQFLEALAKAARQGDAAEDLTRGHALAANPEVRELQERFIAFAADNPATLRDVLRNSADSEQRAAAAHVIGYAPDKRLAADDLQYAMQDPADGVRNNAMRALSAISVLAARNPDLGIRISPTWLIEMLNSIVWTDRNKAAGVLLNLTDGRDPRVLSQLSERALGAIVEMARWKSLGHALPAFFLAGRIAGMPEEEIQDAWSKGEREVVINKALETASRKR